MARNTSMAWPLSFTDFARLRNSMRAGGLRENVFFLHVPKCGGTSIDLAIRQCFVTLDVSRDRDLIRLNSRASAKAAEVLWGSDYTRGETHDYAEMRFRADQSAYLMSIGNARYISGHIPFDEKVHQKYGRSFAYVTVLRDPVERWVSRFFYDKYRTSDHWVIDESLSEYLTTDRARSAGVEYSKYFGGPRTSSDYTCAEAVEAAKRNLHKFQVVGFLDDIERFIRDFRDRFGQSLRIGRKNPGPSSTSVRQSELTAESMEAIRELCAPDLAIYEYAKCLSLPPT